MKFKHSIIATALLGTLSLQVQAAVTQEQVDTLAKQLHLKYQIVNNHAANAGVDCQKLGAEWASCNTAILDLTNQGNAVPGNEWSLYLHSIRRILKLDTDLFTIEHLTGDLYKLTPTAKFSGFQANEAVRVPLIGEYWQLFETDVMPGWYLAADGVEPRVIASMDTEDVSSFVAPITGDNWKRTLDDKNILMTSQTRYVANQNTKVLSADAVRGHIIPTPLQQTLRQGSATLKAVKLEAADLSTASQQALLARFAELGVPAGESGYAIKVSVVGQQIAKNARKAEGYELHIGQQGATVQGFDAAGAFLGVQSLLSVLGANDHLLPLMDVVDAPRFAYRGMQVDVARHFRSVDAIKRLLDQMAAYKLNKLHLGLTNDEGWRLAIAGLPELTEVGGKRCHDLTETKCLLPQLGSGPESNNQGSGFYSANDYISIVQYANARGIEVIPEINTPAHARAAVVSMEARYQKLHAAGDDAAANEYRLLDPADTSNTTSVQFYDRRSYINPCMPGAVKFVGKVMAEVIALHKAAGQPLKTWHYGGDEAKNIQLGGGYQDLKTPADQAVAWKGTIDQSKEDMPWARSPMCQAMIKDGSIKSVEELPSYFALEVGKLVKEHQVDRLQAWQDGLKHVENAKQFATGKTVVNFWDTLYWGGFNAVNEWTHKGYDVVLSNPDYLYFDFPYEVNTKERGYYWATRFNDERKVFTFAPENLPQNAETSVDRDGMPFVAKGESDYLPFLGMSGQQWSETVRTDEQFEYMVFPRMLPLAERAWHKASWELPYVKGREFSDKSKFVDKAKIASQWNMFANVLGQRELAKLDKAGIHYRLPVPGAMLVGGKLEANVALPGIAIQYSTDGQNWLGYDVANKPAVTGKVWLRSVSPDGQRFSRVTEL
jgi:hexosaminidase